MGRLRNRQRRGSGGANGFNPTTAGTVALWLRADLGITLNGGDVSQWNDQSGNGFNVSQGTAANQPLYTANNAAFGGMPTVTYTSANTDALTTGTGVVVATAGARTIFAVVRATDTVGGTLIDFQRDAQDFAFQWFVSGGTRFILTDGVVNTSMTAPPALQNVAYVLTYIDSGSGTALVIRANQVAYATVGNVPIETAVGGGFSVGNRASAGQSFNGDIAELLVYGAALDVTSYTAVENYLRARYSI